MNFQSIWNKQWHSLLMGAMWMTLPGFFVGKIFPWHETFHLGFYIASVIMTSFFFWVLRVWYVKTKDEMPRPFGPRAKYLGLSFLFIILGYVVTGLFWRAVGDWTLYLAKRDVLAAGYSLAPPVNQTVLPDDKNAVCYENAAWNAPSMRVFGPASPIYDIPPKGRFAENDRLYGHLKDKVDLSKRSFFGKQTEQDFLVSFNGAAAAGHLTKEKISYARKLVQEHLDAFRLLDKALEAGKADWGIDWSMKPAWGVPVPHYAHVLMVARLLRLRAWVQAMDGDAKGAARSLQTCFLLADMGYQVQTLIGDMIGVAIDGMTASRTLQVLPVLRAKGKGGADLLGLIQPGKMQATFYRSMEHEFFYHFNYMADYSWWNIPIRELCSFNRNRIGVFVFAVAYYPFIPYDMAAKFESEILLMKALETNPAGWNQAYGQFSKHAWILGNIGLPEFPQLDEKVREAATKCNLCRLAIQAGLFKKKHGDYPASVDELATACKEEGSGGGSGIPPVLVTGTFVAGVKSPEGNYLTFAHQREVPRASGVGWLYDTTTGSVYVNSTVKDSKTIPYSFYGFE